MGATTVTLSRQVHNEGLDRTLHLLESMRCPCCGSSRLQFDANQVNPWQCVQCGSALEVPSPLLGEQSEIKPPRATWERSTDKQVSTRYIGTLATEPRAAGLSKDTLLRELPTWLLMSAMMLGALAAFVLAAHSLYVWLNAVEGILPVGKEGTELFLVVDMPWGLSGLVDSCSAAGLRTWYAPVLLTFDGCLLLGVVWYWSRRRGIISRRV